MNAEINSRGRSSTLKQGFVCQSVRAWHDGHFLSRLERLSVSQVELALALYHDHELMKVLLNCLKIGDTVQRVAISIKDPVSGPFIIVTRDGNFVTCLGEGMFVSGIPVVTQEQFQRVARSVQRARNTMDEIALHPRREVSRVLERLQNCGSNVSREDFLAVAAWQPLLAPAILQAFARANDRLVLTYRELAGRQNRFKRRDENALHRYWMDAWAIAHFTMLLGVDGGHFMRSASHVPEFENVGRALSFATVRLNVASHGIRGAWLAAKVGKPLVPLMKQAYQTPAAALHLVDAGIALSAIGYTHRKLQSEIGKVLGQSERVPEGARGEAVRYLHKHFAAHYQAFVDKPEQCQAYMNEVVDRVAAKFFRIRHPDRGEGDPSLTPSTDVLRDWGTTLLMQTPIPIMDERLRALPKVLLWLPFMVRAKAEDFYVPRQAIPRSARTWTVEDSLALLEPRRQYDKLSGAVPQVAAPKGEKLPGRNEPCHCGSQRKFKHCCAQ